MMKYDMGGSAAVARSRPGPSPSSKPDGVEVHVIVAALRKHDQWRGHPPGDILTASNADDPK